jgi:hypothetical protein
VTNNIDTDKETRIKREIQKLKKIYAGADENKRKAIEYLIENTAYQIVTLRDLRKAIDQNGIIAEDGKKKSPETDAYIQMNRTYLALMKELIEYCPAEKKKDSKLALLRSE